MLSTSAQLQLITRDMNKALDRVARAPEVARETAYYLANLAKTKTVAEFVSNRRLFTYALKAHGLGSMANAQAYMKRVLVEGADNPEAFARKLSDPRFAAFARTFNFARYGATALTFDRAQQGTVDAYVRQALEEKAGVANEGVRLALYFDRNAANARTALDLLADPALLKVVQVGLSMPELATSGNIDRLADFIDSRLTISDLKNPHERAKFIERFTHLWEGSHSESTVASTLIGSARAVAGLPSEILLSLQTIRNR